MTLIQIFLPLYDNESNALPNALFGQVRDELVERFGGLTAHSRSPVHGLWQEENGATVVDDLIVYEVMTEEIDHTWWRDYRTALEQRFRQESIVVRAQSIQLL